MDHQMIKWGAPVTAGESEVNIIEGEEATSLLPQAPTNPATDLVVNFSHREVGKRERPPLLSSDNDPAFYRAAQPLLLLSSEEQGHDLSQNDQDVESTTHDNDDGDDAVAACPRRASIGAFVLLSLVVLVLLGVMCLPATWKAPLSMPPARGPSPLPAAAAEMPAASDSPVATVANSVSEGEARAAGPDEGVEEGDDATDLLLNGQQQQGDEGPTSMSGSSSGGGGKTITGTESVNKEERGKGEASPKTSTPPALPLASAPAKSAPAATLPAPIVTAPQVAVPAATKAAASTAATTVTKKAPPAASSTKASKSSSSSTVLVEAASLSPIAQWARFPEARNEGAKDDTEAVQSAIYRHQNPENCSAAKYFVWQLNSYGMGSDLHTTGWALGEALAHGRVLIYNTYDRPWVYTDPTACPGNRQTADCFFKPLSRCQDYVTKDEIASARAWPAWDSSVDQSMLTRDRVVLLPFLNTQIVQFFIPPPWQDRAVSWWRAQTTRYLVRPNEEQMAWTSDYLASSLTTRGPEGQEPEGWSAATVPPPPDAICIHIRHGDKGSEMRLRPLVDYLGPAWELIQSQGAAPNVFLSTDDEAVIQEVEAGQIAALHGYRFQYYYFKYHRRNDLGPQATADFLGKGYFGRVSVANLLLGVHPSCKWFVQTTGSNWNRLINEIRKTDGQRANATWVDLEEGEWRARRRRIRSSSRKQENR